MKKQLLSNQTQLNLLGIVLLAVLGLCAWSLTHPLTVYSFLPLLLLGYAAFRVVFELTINRANVPTLATSLAGRAQMTKILRQAAEGKTDFTIMDLGSGRGELTRYIAKALPQARVMGLETARIPFWQSQFMQRWFGPKNLSYQRLDFFTFDCSKLDAVVFYLSGNFVLRVGDKLKQELKPGAVVISHTFPLRDDWTPAEVLTFRSPFKETIYVYRKA